MGVLKFSFKQDPQKLIDELMQDVKATMPKLVDAFSREVEVNARKNFNRAVNDISGDNPYVSVSRTVSGNNAKIICGGEQVLYAEFGAGLQNSYREKEVYVESHFAISRSNTLYYVQGHYRTIGLNAKGFAYKGMFEDLIFYERPQGIVPLGNYGVHGKDDFWFRPSTNGRTGSMEAIKKKRNGELDPRYVWTMGTVPVRGLCRARNTAINKLQSGRLNIK